MASAAPGRVNCDHFAVLAGCVNGNRLVSPGGQLVTTVRVILMWLCTATLKSPFENPTLTTVHQYTVVRVGVFLRLIGSYCQESVSSNAYGAVPMLSVPMLRVYTEAVGTCQICRCPVAGAALRCSFFAHTTMFHCYSTRDAQRTADLACYCTARTRLRPAAGPP